MGLQKRRDMVNDARMVCAVDRDDVIRTYRAWNRAIFVREDFHRNVQIEPSGNIVEKATQIRQLLVGDARGDHGRERAMQPRHGGIVEIPAAIEHSACQRGHNPRPVFETDCCQDNESISHLQQRSHNQIFASGIIPAMAPPGNTTDSAAAPFVAYTAKNLWMSERPRALVVCCSDGRLQESIDEFLSTSLGIVDYDRLFAPGGPGAISEVGGAFTHALQYRADLKLLLDAHSFHRIVLIFHGSAPDGPEHSGCAHYGKILPGRPYPEIVARHEADRKDVIKYLLGLRPSLDIDTYRAEVTADRQVQFLDLTPGQG
jgi:hypothetical protein